MEQSSSATFGIHFKSWGWGPDLPIVNCGLAWRLQGVGAKERVRLRWTLWKLCQAPRKLCSKVTGMPAGNWWTAHKQCTSLVLHEVIYPVLKTLLEDALKTNLSWPRSCNDEETNTKCYCLEGTVHRFRFCFCFICFGFLQALRP